MALKKKKIVIGNWKMNIFTSKEAVKLVEGIKKESIKAKNTDIVVCPPFVYLADLKSVVSKKVALGVQNIFEETAGSYTGEVSAQHLTQFKVSYVIIGHSERRARGESDTSISKKIVRALENKITPVFCIGEASRDEQGEYLSFIKSQLVVGLSGVSKMQISDVVVAYEPIWAIGATEAMNSHQVHEMSLYIQKCIKEMYGTMVMMPRILYGGAVNADNAREIVDRGYVDGLLVGRESLKVENFVGIIKNVDLIK
ncbi:MAG: triose-phosphate isomerase [Candidatus Zambryskibacteria bacterium]|nr:triose-phosphate isomerase [Candidatus Zambryskibacteria bacterium]